MRYLNVVTVKVVMCKFIDNLDIFLLILHGDIVSIYKLTVILKIICQSDFKHMMLPIKTIMSVLNVSTYIIYGIIALPFRLSVIQSIMSVSNFCYSIYIYNIFIKTNTAIGLNCNVV